jgi:RNA recognition motif-containing protein
MGIRLYVGNLPFNVTEAELRELFSTIGQLSYLSIPTDRETGKQRGFAFVEFKDRAQADEAIRRFNNQSFQGRFLSVSEARARDESRRAAAPTRPSGPRPASTAGADPADPPSNKPNRNLGPDAPSRHGRSKAKSEFRSERGPKGPMREVVRGQFFGEAGDEDDDDDYNDYDNYNEETDEENLDAGVSDPEKGS